MATCVTTVSQLLGDEYLESSGVFCATIHPPFGLCRGSMMPERRCMPHAAMTLA